MKLIFVGFFWEEDQRANSIFSSLKVWNFGGLLRGGTWVRKGYSSLGSIPEDLVLGCCPPPAMDEIDLGQGYRWAASVIRGKNCFLICILSHREQGIRLVKK